MKHSIYQQLNHNAMEKTFTFTESEINKLGEDYKKSLLDNFLKSLDNVPLNESVECPCCKGLVTKYKRTLNTGQAYFLYELFKAYRRTGEVWHRFNDIQAVVEELHNRRCTDYTKLKDFGMIKSKGTTRGDGNSAGYFAVTQRGAMFLEGKLSIPEYLIQDNNGNTLQTSENKISITDMVKDFHFDNQVHPHQTNGI